MEKQIVEINGIKLEIDMRHAKKIDSYKVGDNVKVLIKSYGDTYNTYPGVIIGFDNFEKLPTITVCYVDIGYSNAEVKFININAKSSDYEIVHMQEHEKIVDKKRALDLLTNVIDKAKAEVDNLERKRAYFIEKFNQHCLTLEQQDIHNYPLIDDAEGRN